MQGVYRVWDGGRELLESFVAAPGPMGWRYFGRVHPPKSEEELFTVDHVVDAEWGLLRYRLLDQSGARIVATPSTGGIELVTGRPGEERTETVAGDGTLAGALYNPAVEIVPAAAVPPATPFTLQVTP